VTATDDAIGLYDRHEGVVKWCWPEAPLAPALERAYVLSLASFWLETRCPRWREGDLRVADDAPGSWADDALPFLLAEGHVDLSTGTWSCAGTASERRRELRILRDGGLLLPWADLFGASWQARALLSREARTGRDGSRASALSAYVVQAVAAAEYAYSAEGGALRRAYADLVTSYNLGRPEGLTVFEAFGLTAEALGARVEAWTAR